MDVTDDELVVRAVVSAVAKLPEDAVERLGDERTFTLLASATTEAVKLKFATAPDSPQIQEFVQALKNRFTDGADLIKSDVAEAVVRSAFGEVEYLAGVGPGDLRALLFLVPYAVVSEAKLTPRELDRFVRRVIAMTHGG